MTAIDNRGVTIDWCEFCASLWFDPEELAHALSNGFRRPRERDPFEKALPSRGLSGLSCPRCRPQFLAAVGWEGLSFSQCPKCNGILLERGQLADLRTRFANGPEGPTSGPRDNAVREAPKGLAQWAELLWTAAQMVGRIKLGWPAS